MFGVDVRCLGTADVRTSAWKRGPTSVDGRLPSP